MKTKLWAVLFSLLLISASALAEIDLTPYEVPSEYGSSVLVLSPSQTLVLTDKTFQNTNTMPTAITLYDKETISQQIELPDYAQDGTRQLYDLFAASSARYGLITYQPNAETERPVRFQLLSDNGLTEGITLTSGFGLYRFTSNFLLNRRYEGDTQFIDRHDLNGTLLSSTPISQDLAGAYSYTCLSDGTLVCVSACDDGLHVLHLCEDGTLISDLPIPNSAGHLLPKTYFSENGGILCQSQIGDPYQSSVLNCADEQNTLLWSKTLSAPNAIVSVTRVQFLPHHETLLMGVAVANSRKLFTIFKLHVDAQGDIISRDIRDFTTRATYLYDAVTDTLGNLYAVTSDIQAHPIAIVPFEDLPAHDDPGLVLE